MWTAFIAAAASIITLVVKYFSPDSELTRRRIADAEAKAREDVAAAKLEARYAKIELEAGLAARSAAEAADRLNAKFAKRTRK